MSELCKQKSRRGLSKLSAKNTTANPFPVQNVAVQNAHACLHKIDYAVVEARACTIPNTDREKLAKLLNLPVEALELHDDIYRSIAAYSLKVDPEMVPDFARRQVKAHLYMFIYAGR